LTARKATEEKQTNRNDRLPLAENDEVEVGVEVKRREGELVRELLLGYARGDVTEVSNACSKRRKRPSILTVCSIERK
jgi:hypothetical protein